MTSKPEPNTAEPYLPSDRSSLSRLRAASQLCRGCELYRHATQAVFGEGSVVAGTMLIGEQPGDREDREGHPFVGPAGKLLSRALEEAGFDHSEVFITNAVKHFKWEPRGKRRLHQKPTISEMRACFPWLRTEIALVRPRVILCLGASSAKMLLGPQFRITKGRGEFRRSDFGALLGATYHPSAILRAQTEEARTERFQTLVVDLRRARELSQADLNRPEFDLPEWRVPPR